ncbi:MAG TPA: c-type cytochrome domain-containing protein, partial [Chryseolinea sp.]|nr:c-type cytochrome domain-containing protein [Chryseolinea sp.]
MDLIIQFFGRFHPLVVHLPIGILFLAFLFECLSRFDRFKSLRNAVQLSLLIGSVFAFASVVTGLFLSQEGGYDDVLLQRHQNLGIATAVFVVVLYFLCTSTTRFFRNEKKLNAIRMLCFIAMITMLSATGHYGGSMTHGEEYLFESVATSQSADPMSKLKTIANPDEAVLYNDIIEPILNSKCYSCHSSKKKKGDLRLDQVDFIMQGGKHGVVIKAGLPDSSSLYRRLMLPIEDEDHMPPGERPQLSSSEIALIKTWIDEGASFDRSVKNFSQAEKIKSYINTLITQLLQEPLVPDKEVAAADPKKLNALRQRGVLILPLGNETNYLSVSFVNAQSATDADLQLLLALKDQLLWLNLANTRISNKGIEIIAQLKALRQLYLNNTQITDNGVKHLISLADLTYLNLVGTGISDEGLLYLSEMPKLKNIFVYQTKISANGVQLFSKKSTETRV